MDKHTTPLPHREGAVESILPILQVGDVLISPDILTERFCCDYEKCRGACCVEGNAGAPVTLDEIGEIEGVLDTVWPDLTAQAQAVIDRQGVAYSDPEGDLVTSIVGGRECVFASFTPSAAADGGTSTAPYCRCTLETACRAGRTRFMKPLSCSLYPIRAKLFSNGTVGLNYHRWAICRDAVARGRELDMPVYRFLEEPLVRRFGQDWYDELCQLADELRAQGLL